jgi:hypothetical protein
MKEHPNIFDPTEPDADDELPIPTDDEAKEIRTLADRLGPEPAGPPAPDQGVLASEEQMLYARILAAGMYLGLAVLLVTFALYLTGVIDPAVPIHELPDYWTLSAHEYLEAINHDFLHREGVVVGWGWIWVLNRGDYLNFIGIALLALVTIACYLGILPTLFRKKDWIFGTIAILEVMILALAASGLVSAGH